MPFHVGNGVENKHYPHGLALGTAIVIAGGISSPLSTWFSYATAAAAVMQRRSPPAAIPVLGEKSVDCPVKLEEKVMTKDEVVAARRANLAVIADQFRSKTALAKRCGKSVQQIWGMIEGTASFGHRVARDIESSLGLPEKSLDVPNMAKADHPDAAEDDGLIRIEALEPLPEYGLKAGTHISEVKLLKVEKGWLNEQDIDAWRIKNLKFVTAPNDAMEPTIPEGAAVIIDNAQRTINYDGLFAVSYDGKLVIHRIQCLPGNSFYLLSDNPRCEIITIDSLKGIHILGRCLGALWARRF